MNTDTYELPRRDGLKYGMMVIINWKSDPIAERFNGKVGTVVAKVTPADEATIWRVALRHALKVEDVTFHFVDVRAADVLALPLPPARVVLEPNPYDLHRDGKLFD